MSGVSDDAVVKFLIDYQGHRTFQLARQFRAGDTAKMRRQLLRLEANGRVKRDPRFTYVNDIFWCAILPREEGDTGGGEHG